jgi:hypothetical protein
MLTGPASGEWTFALGGSLDTITLTVSMEAVDFARLVANRRPPAALRYTVDGDSLVARQVLLIASTLGCD